MKNTKAELKDNELENVTGGLAPIDIPSSDPGYDVSYEKGTDWEPDKPINAGEYKVSITPKGEYN